MRRILLFTWLLVVACAAVGQDSQVFGARLAPLPLDVENRNQVTGSGAGSAVLDGRRLIVTGSFAGLQAPATVAHLHLGPALGIRGGSVLDLIVDQAVAGDFSGEWTLSAEQLQALHDGRLYIQIHSQIAPAGNLWGWLLP
jgi:hypothetical protein